MLYLVTYALRTYEPGMYDEFYETLTDLHPRLPIRPGLFLHATHDSAKALAQRLGSLLAEEDSLYVLAFEYPKISGTITPAIHAFIKEHGGDAPPLFGEYIPSSLPGVKY